MGERLTYATTEIVAFAPSPNTAFTFQPTLDGQLYTAIITNNVFRRPGDAEGGWYLNIYTLQGARVLTVAMVGSPNDYDINLTQGYFTTVLVYRADLQQFEILSDPVT